MTTIEFVTKCLNKAKLTLEIQSQRKATPEMLKNLEEKVEHYEDILREIKEAQLTRKYIYDNGLLYELVAYGRKEGFWSE
jgi:hypothetical protein